MDKIDLKQLNIDELTEFLISLGEPKFRAKQIFEWIHQKLVTNFSDMKNIPKSLIEKLETKAYLNNIKVYDKLVSKEDGTIKFLWELQDGNIIESVLMSYEYGNAVCISTQVGCKMACSFCASAIGGFIRNLSASEMLSEVYEMQKYSDKRISNIVLMGSGEPLDNYENVKKFLSLVNSPSGLNIGLRHITLSTCGLIDKIYELADENLQITLAISLHAPNDEMRNKIMPVSFKNPMDKLLEACRYYTKKTSRRITFEYALIDGINDTKEIALMLSEKLKNMLCHVNLIPVNDVKERNFKKSSKQNIQEFAKTLEKSGISVTVRRKLGSDINASCGQLRKHALENKERRE